MSAATHTHDHGHGHDDAHDHHGPPHGITRWFYTTNHKDIGTMYLVFAGVMFFLGGAMAMVIRAELFKPGLQFVDPQFFNSLDQLAALAATVAAAAAAAAAGGAFFDASQAA